MSYSPLHNVKFPKDGQWPSTLMMTADHDDRVVPSHTLKPKKHKLQTNPLLVRVEKKAGHGGGGMSFVKQIAGYVDTYSFLQRVLNIEWVD
ncbi:hypothetical protein COOONC_25651 [Cooperia oncophora]